jgi:paraquat-inducible protein B
VLDAIVDLACGWAVPKRRRGPMLLWLVRLTAMLIGLWLMMSS